MQVKIIGAGLAGCAKEMPLSVPAPPVRCMSAPVSRAHGQGCQAPGAGHRCGANGKPLLLDCGANVECRPEMLNAFGTMGSVYAEGHGPRNAEGRACQQRRGGHEGARRPTARPKLLKANPCIHFAGNIEPRYIMDGDVDVVVCDSFVGNVVLKLTEASPKRCWGC